MSHPLLLAVNDFPPLLGGEATLYHALARHLSRSDAVVLAPRGPGDATLDAGLPVEVVRCWLPAHGGGLRRAARALIGGVHLAGLLARRHFGYLVCGQLLSIGAPLALLARLSGKPYAVIVHGADLADFADRWPWRGLARIVLAGAHTVVANSRFTAGLVDRLLPGAARRIIVLPMGVDPAPPADASRLERLRSAYGLRGPVLLSVSRLVPMKGHDIVIESLPRLLGEFPDLRYLIVGEGPHREALERLARDRGVAAQVIFAGRVSAEDLAEHYALATLFVQLSRDTGPYDSLEGFGLTFLEAASHGVVSIAGRSGGVPEAVDDGRSGVLIPPEEPTAFAAVARRLLSNRTELKRLSEAARRWAMDHPWEGAARCLLSLRNDVVTEKRLEGRRRSV